VIAIVLGQYLAVGVDIGLLASLLLSSINITGSLPTMSTMYLRVPSSEEFFQIRLPAELYSVLFAFMSEHSLPSFSIVGGVV